MDKENILNESPMPAEDAMDLLGNGKVLKRIIKKGDEGNRPAVGDEVTVHYEGSLTDGSVFDSSHTRQTPFDFILGAGQVIKGWDVGVASMNKGEIAELTLEPDFAYGKHGSPPKIPPNAVLKFKVELLKFAQKKKDKNLMTAEERLQSANESKEQGNKAFKEGDYVTSRQEYTSARDYLEGYEDWAEHLAEQVKPMKLAIHLNLANSCLKNQSWLECVIEATAALQLEPGNIKALFRRGVARTELGELEAAKVDLIGAAKLDPQNMEIRKALQKCKDETARYAKESSATYQRMFR